MSIVEINRAVAVLSLLAAVMLPGCVSRIVAESPHVSGRVVDADTKLGIAGASIRVSGHPESTVKSKSDGSFEINPEFESEKFALLPSAVTVRVKAIPIEVEASGYYPGEVTGVRSNGKTITRSDVEIVELRRR